MSSVIYLLFTIAGWGLYHIFVKIASRSLQPLSIQLISSACHILSLPLYYWLFTKTVHNFPKFNVNGVLWAIAAYIATSIGTISYIYAIKQEEVSSAVCYAGTYPIFTVIVAIIFLGETITLQKIIGVVLVLFGVFIASR